MDIEKLAELTGIDRAGFIQSFTIVLPGTINQYQRSGQTGILILTTQFRPLVFWKDGAFILNTKELEAQCNRFNVYAESKEQNDLLKYWNDLAETVNKHRELLKTDAMDSYQLAKLLNLEFDGNTKTLKPKYTELATKIKELAVN